MFIVLTWIKVLKNEATIKAFIKHRPALEKKVLKVFLHHKGKIYHKSPDAKDKMKSIREGALGKYKGLFFSTIYFILVNSFNRPMTVEIKI